MNIPITDKSEHITISFIRFDDIFGRVVAIKGWQYKINKKGE